MCAVHDKQANMSRAIDGEELAPVGPRKGRKSVAWMNDPAILMRLEIVSELMLQGGSNRRIGHALNYSHETARTDIERVRELWRKRATTLIVDQRAESIAQFRLLQEVAWSSWDKKHDLAALREIRECERQIVAILGTQAPKQIDMLLDDNRERPMENMTDEELQAILDADDYEE